jgi:hypothetical protein
VEQKCFSTILFAFREPNQVHLKEQGALGPTRHGFHFHILCGDHPAINSSIRSRNDRIVTLSRFRSACGVLSLMIGALARRNL